MFRRYRECDMFASVAVFDLERLRLPSAATKRRTFNTDVGSFEQKDAEKTKAQLPLSPR